MMRVPYYLLIRRTNYYDLFMVFDLKKVSIVLDQFSEIDRSEVILNSNGGIDIVKFNEMEKVTKLVSELKKLGVKNNSELYEAGFMPAGMLLRF